MSNELPELSGLIGGLMQNPSLLAGLSSLLGNLGKPSAKPGCGHSPPCEEPCEGPCERPRREACGDCQGKDDRCHFASDSCRKESEGCDFGHGERHCQGPGGCPPGGGHLPIALGRPRHEDARLCLLLALRPFLSCKRQETLDGLIRIWELFILLEKGNGGSHV